jgi:long-chain fatty acid transport protein
LRARRLAGSGLLLAASFLGDAGPAAAQSGQDELLLAGRSPAVILGSGARAFGMGGAFLARADDATAASWNPAGLSYLGRPEISLVGARSALDTDSRSFTDPADFQLDSFLGYTPDFVSAAHPIEIGEASGSVQLSFQRVISFKGKRTIERPTRPRRLESEGGFDVVAFGTGLQVSRKVRVGATLNRWLNGFHQVRERLERVRTLQEADFRIRGWNVNLGLIVTPAPTLNFGLVFKTPFTAGVTLTRRRTDFSSEPTTEDTSNSFTSDAVRLDFPGALGFGVSWRPRSPLTVSVDYTRTFWSDARIRSFFLLPPTGPPQVFDTLPFPDLETDLQADTEQIRLGIEYVVIGRRLKWPLRAGYFNDRQFFLADGEAPRFNGFTAGVGMLVGPVLFDVAYLRESGSYTDLETRVDVKVQRVFASVIYRFGSN